MNQILLSKPDWNRIWLDYVLKSDRGKILVKISFPPVGWMVLILISAGGSGGTLT